MLTHAEEVTDLRGATFSVLVLDKGFEGSVVTRRRCVLRSLDKGCKSNNARAQEKHRGQGRWRRWLSFEMRCE